MLEIVSEIDLFNFVLKHFYPKKKITYKDTDYKSLEEKYIELTNVVYNNGALYIGEENINISSSSRTRSIDTTKAYLVTETNEANGEKTEKLYLSIKLNGFTKNQIISGVVNYNLNDTDFTFPFSDRIYDGGFTKTALDSEITLDNIISVSILKTESVIENYINYSSVDPVSFTANHNMEIILGVVTLLEITSEQLDDMIENPSLVFQRYLWSAPMLKKVKRFDTDLFDEAYQMQIKNFCPSGYHDSQTFNMSVARYDKVNGECKLIKDNQEVYSSHTESTNQGSKTTLGDYTPNDPLIYDLYDEEKDNGDFKAIVVTISIPPYTSYFNNYNGMVAKIYYEDIAEENTYYAPSKIRYIK